jgi:hypothetical protein
MQKLEDALRATHLLLEDLERDRASGTKELRSRFDRLGKAMLLESRGERDAMREETLTAAATALRSDAQEATRRHRSMRRMVTLMMD